MELTPGANVELDGTTLRLTWTRNPGRAEIDASAYLLTAAGKVRGDTDMVFFNQVQVPGLTMQSGDREASFTLTPGSIDAAIQRIAFCIALDGSKDPAARLAHVGAVEVRNGAHSFRVDVSAATEAALILVEVYRRNAVWKLRAVGQGFVGGLAPLARHFGVEVNAEPAPSVHTPPTPAPPAAVNLTKVTLAKAQAINLRKAGGAIRARLVWEGRSDGSGDLDFYCFYVLKDGTRGKVYWKDHGKEQTVPFITLSGDSQRAGEEEIILHRPEELRFALFAAYSALSNGAGSFQSYRPKMILTDRGGNEVIVPLLNPNNVSYWVAISHIGIDADIRIEHVETYGKPGSFMNLLAAERAPRLHADGTWDVSKGELEFKPSKGN